MTTRAINEFLRQSSFAGGYVQEAGKSERTRILKTHKSKTGQIRAMAMSGLYVELRSGMRIEHAVLRESITV